MKEEKSRKRRLTQHFYRLAISRRPGLRNDNVVDGRMSLAEAGETDLYDHGEVVR